MLAVTQGLLIDILWVLTGRSSRPQQPHQPLDCVSQGGDALGDRPEPIESQTIDRQVAVRGQDLETVELPVAVGVFAQWHIAHAMPAVFDRPEVSDVPQQGLGSGPRTCDVVTGLVLWLAITDAIAADRDNLGAARALLNHSLPCWHCPQGPGDVTAPIDFPSAGAP